MIINQGGGGGIDISQTTATPGDIRKGKTAGLINKVETGTMENLGAVTISPGTTNQIIPPGKYIDENITIKGDSDLIPANIKQGVDIFGILGTMVQGQDCDIGVMKATVSGKNLTLPTSKKRSKAIIVFYYTTSGYSERIVYSESETRVADKALSTTASAYSRGITFNENNLAINLYDNVGSTSKNQAFYCAW